MRQKEFCGWKHAESIQGNRFLGKKELLSIYAKLKAIDVERGGTLSHTAIIGREYGVPTIVNTFEGTAKIKSGQRIRINAANGAVFILDE